MSLQDLLKRDQTRFVQNPKLSLSEIVEYTHANLGEIGEVYVFASFIEANQDEDKKRLNKLELANVIIPVEPTKLDTFVYQNKEWKVREWFSSNGMYRIIADNNKRNRVN